MMNRCRVLVVDRDANVVKSLLNTLRENGYEAYGTCSPKAAGAIIPQFPLDAIVSGASCGPSVINAARAAARTNHKSRVLLLSPTAPDSSLDTLARQVDATVRTAPVESYADETLNFMRAPQHFPHAA
jgi:DNA-binding NtrC family response regulator